MAFRQALPLVGGAYIATHLGRLADGSGERRGAGPRCGCHQRLVA